MSCPPGSVLNPRTLRCVRGTGKTARRLIQRGNIADFFGYPQTQYRRTVRQPRIAAAFGVGPRTYCPTGYEHNPTTGRCIKIGGKTHAKLYPQVKQPQPVQEQELRRTSSEGPLRLPLGSAGVAPLADKPIILDWARQQCRNDRDPISGIHFAAAEAAALQDIVRLHERTCTLSGPLHAKVAAEHKANHVATIPGNPSDHMTLDDFNALRDSMRRHNPAYKIPGRKHQPPPANWRLYVASDNRSGPEFASVLYVNIDKVIQGPQGPQYPVDSVQLDLGFIPVNYNGAREMVNLIQQLAISHRLVSPVAGGWKPIAGFPNSKQYWTGPDGVARFNKLYRDLKSRVASPA